MIDRVVLITIDALRADQPWSGYTKAKTPNLSRFVEQSVFFARTYATANTTGPSLSSLLAVRYPTELPRDDCPLAGFEMGDGLAPVLQRGGVWTAAAHGHAYFAGSSAPKDGFTAWRTVDNVAGRLATEGAVTGPEVTKLAINLVQEAPADGKSFIWAHYLEPHDAYVRHKDFPATDEPRRGVYDGEVAFADDQAGKLLAAIDASPAASRTAVIVASDHGEAFGEHERYRHGFTVFEEEVRVPLMVRVPGVPPHRIDAPRGTMDIPKTIADLLSVQAPDRWRGNTLVQDLRSPSPPQRPVIVDVPRLMNLPAQQVVVLGDYKVVLQGTRWSVFNLRADPKEARRLPKEQAEPFIEKAKAALARIETVPSGACKSAPFRLKK
ncbi:MAG: sulfatase [Polyangiaceae bacterium]|nr:sulfatase [Polyangiaceae bacterium]